MRSNLISSLVLSTFAVSVLFLQCCKEVGPEIDFKPKFEGDTTYVTSSVPNADEKVAYLEEFTGVQCVNCSQGHQVVSDLLTQHGERLAAVGVHAGPFSAPYTGTHTSLYDFQTVEGNTINNTFYGGVPGQPMAGIDRRLFRNQGNRATLRSNWSKFVTYQLKETNPCNLKLTSIFDAVANKLKVKATVTYTADVVGDTKLTLLLSESGIKDAQLLPDGTVDENYIHRHVFRTTLTPPTGALLQGAATRGRVFVRNFEFTPNITWKIDSCELVGFVHEASDSVRVLQATKIKAK